jgi:hypothetical protein
MIWDMTSADDVTHQLTLKIRDWLYIDGTMDNNIRRCRDMSDDEEEPSGTYWNALAMVGSAIREAGWRQLPGWPDSYDGLQRWGRAGETGAIDLTDEQWTLVVAALQHAATVQDANDDPEHAARSRALAAAVRAELAQQGLIVQALQGFRS